MGSCGSKNSIIKGTVFRVSAVHNCSDINEIMFGKRENSILSPSNLSSPQLVSSRSSQYFLPIPQERQHRRTSSASTSSKTYLKAQVIKTESDCKMIKSALQKHFIFSSLNEIQIATIIKKMEFFVYPKQIFIFEQNTVGENFFIISKGKAEVVINLKVVAVLNVGDSFGEVALLHDTPRTASVVTVVETSLWGLDRGTFRGILQDMSSQNYSENMEFIENAEIFKTLTRKQNEALANSMNSERYSSGHRILHEGDQGDFMFIIKEGTVIVTQKGVEIRKLKKNDYFGEQALLNNRLRTASVTALDPVQCLSINSEELFAALGNNLQDVIHFNTQRMAIDADSILQKLTPGQIQEIITKTKVSRYKRGEIVVPAGIAFRTLYIVLSGTLSSRNNKVKSLQILGSQEFFNNRGGIPDNYVAIEDSDIAEISKIILQEAIGGQLFEILELNEVLKVIKEIDIFRGVDLKTLERLVKMSSTVKFKNQAAIVTQNQPGDSFFIVKSGSVEVKKSGVFIRNISKNNYFGERSLLFNKNRSATVRAIGDVECWVLTTSQFNSIFDQGMKQQLLDRIELQDDNIELVDLCFVKLLYQSKTATYIICTNKNSQKLYILQAMVRNTLIRLNLQKPIVSQKKILSQIEHNFIMHLVRTFKDPKRLCMLLEYIEGEDFSLVLENLKKPNELDCRFYTGCLLLILDYLHDHGIIYRDLSIKNIRIDSQGYPKLMDFSSSKFIQGRTYTLIGTPHYVAPEVISGHGYGISADYWSLGINLYMIMYGMLPFGNTETDPVQIYQKIINHRVVFPNSVDPLSKPRDFISNLLNKDPIKRGTIEKLKMHPWFVGLSWESLGNKQIKAPFLPVIPDLSHFVRSAIKQQKSVEDYLATLEDPSDLCIPRFNLNTRWDAEF